MGHYRFRLNLDSEFYVRKQIFWAMGESGHGFVLKVMRKSKFKKKFKKQNTSKWLNMAVPNCFTVIVTIF